MKMAYFSVASLMQLGFSYTLTPTLAKVYTPLTINRQTQVNVDNVDPTPTPSPPKACTVHTAQSIDRSRYYDHCCPTNRKVMHFYMTMKMVLLKVG